MRARTSTIVKDGKVPFEVATWLWQQTALADAEDQARSAVKSPSDAFISRRCPSPPINPTADPGLGQWKYQYGYDPLCSASWTHIATEHVGLHNPPSPCCGSLCTVRKVMRQQTAETVLYPAGIKLPMSSAPASPLFSELGSGVKLAFTGSSPMPMFVAPGTYRVKKGGHEDGCAKAGDSTQDHVDSLDPLCVMRMPEPVAIKVPTDPEGLLGIYGHGWSFATAVLEDALRGGEGCATYSSIEENKAELNFERASHGVAVTHVQFMHHLEVEIGEIEMDALSGLDQHRLLRRLLLERLWNMADGKRFLPLQKPGVLFPSADVCGSVMDIRSRFEVPLLRRYIQGVACAVVDTNASSVTFGHCQPIARCYPEGAKIQMRAADKSKGTSAVMKVWGDNDSVSRAELEIYGF